MNEKEIKFNFTTLNGASATIVAEESTVSPDIGMRLQIETNTVSIAHFIRGISSIKETPHKGIRCEGVTNGKLRKMFVTLDDETAEQIQTFCAEVEKSAKDRRNHWIEINLGTCFHSDYSCHWWRGDDRTPIEQITEEAKGEMAGCGCWKEGAIETEIPQKIAKVFLEKNDRIEKEMEREKQYQEKKNTAIKEAKETGKNVTIACVGGYDGDDVYPEQELGWIGVYEVATPEGKIITKESPSY